MFERTSTTIAIVVFGLSVIGTTQLSAAQTIGHNLGSESVFESNVGQTAPQVEFISRTAYYTALLEREGLTIRVRAPRTKENASQVLRMRLVHLQPGLRGSGKEELEGKSHYLIGNDPAKWHTNVPLFARVEYRSVYPGIDLAYYGHESELEYDFLVRPGADAHKILFHFEGAKKAAIDSVGALRLELGEGEFQVLKPIVYQIVAGARRQVSGSFVGRGRGNIGFSIGEYDRSLPLVIDPTLVYSTYLGDTQDEGIFGIGFDAFGNLYVAGETSSPDFPTRGALQPHVGGNYDAFVSKFDHSGKRLIYSTYLGGSGYDHAVALAVSPEGSAYLTGVTQSPDFPTMRAVQTKFVGRSDTFIARLSPSGARLIFSTYLGGSGDNQAGGLAVDAKGSAYVAGFTNSVDFPTQKPLQRYCDGASSQQASCSGDSFVTKFSGEGSLLYSSYLGGSGSDHANGIAVDDSGNFYVTGQTGSKDFPVKEASQKTLAGFFNAFVTKFSSDASQILFSTYLGGSGFDGAQDIALDAHRNVYLTGHTNSPDFPIKNPAQAQFKGIADGFVAKFDPAASHLMYSSYLGGSGFDYPVRIAVDASGAATVTGFTSSKDFPLKDALVPTFAGGNMDAFVSKFDRTGTALAFSSYVGGTGDDFGYAIAVDLSGAVWLGGSTTSKDFPVKDGYQKSFAGGPFDAYLSEVAFSSVESLDVLEAGVQNLVLLQALSARDAQALVAELSQAESEVASGQSDKARSALAQFDADVVVDIVKGKLGFTNGLRLLISSSDIGARL